MSRRAQAGLLVGVLLFCGCRPRDSHSSTQLNSRVVELEAANVQGDAKANELKSRAQDIQRATRELLVLWEQVEADMNDAARRLESAASRWGEATAAYQQAKEDYERAERNWKIVAATLMVASLSKSGRSSLCDGQMNTAKVRRLWRKQGYDLEGLDADHIWPKSLGGANHPWNYQRMSSSLNRSLGNKLGWKLLNEPLALLRGGAVSAAVALTCR